MTVKNPPAWLIQLLAVACGLTVANLYYAQPLLNLLHQSFHIGPEAAGALVTATQLGYAAGMLFLVPLGDRLENRRLVTLLLSVTTVALVAVGTARSYGILLGAMLVVGVTSVVAQVLVPYAADLASDENRGRVVGRVMGGLLTGILLSRVVGSLLADVTSWRVVYLLSAGLSAVLVLTLRLALPPRQPTTTVPYGQLLHSTASMFRTHPALVRRSLYQAAMFGSFSVFWTTIAFILTGPLYHYSQLGIALFALAGAAGALIAPQAGKWADRGISRQMTAVCMGLAVAAFALAGLGRHHISLLALAAVLLDLAVQAAGILNQHRIYQLDRAARARINSGYIATIFVAAAIGSELASIAYHAAGWSGVTVLGAACPVAGLLLWLKPGPAAS